MRYLASGALSFILSSGTAAQQLTALLGRNAGEVPGFVKANVVAGERPTTRIFGLLAVAAYRPCSLTT